jgi:hypothetical protein
MPKHLVSETMTVTQTGALAVGQVGLDLPMPYDGRLVDLIGRLKTAPTGTTSLTFLVGGVNYGQLVFTDSQDATGTGMSSATITRGTPVQFNASAVGSPPGSDLVVALVVARA